MSPVTIIGEFELWSKTLPTEKLIQTTCSRRDAGIFGGGGGGTGGGGTGGGRGGVGGGSGGSGGSGSYEEGRREGRSDGGGAEGGDDGGGGGGGGTRGRGVLGPAEKFEAVKVASSLGLQGPSAPIGAQLLATGGGSEDAPAATVYHANLVAGSNTSVVTAALQQPVLASLNSVALASMQASAEANSLDIQAMQSMDWLFKKERIYLLAQFWQQNKILANIGSNNDIGTTPIPYR
ncbi:hypothetical protein M0804_009283 [Polistes exclamans]|nr:hypothetical protein M0804_009283 [Polistes exclamans]